MNNKLAALVCVLFLTGCGDNSSGTGTTSPSDVDNFIPANAIDSYRLSNGSNQLAALNAANANDYVRLLFSPVLRAPDTVLRHSGSAQGLQLAEADFMRSQEMLLERLKRKALTRHYSRQRSVDISDPAACSNGGNVRLSGELYDSLGKGKLKLTYNNCKTGGYILQGDAFLLIYAINGSFNSWSSATLSYNNLQTVRVSNNQSVLFNGTIDEVNDVNTGSVRKTMKLHRQNAVSGQQTLTDTVRQLTGANSTVDMSGNLHEGRYGRVELTTVHALTYNSADMPTSGYIKMTGANNSQVAVTALGERLDPATGRNIISLQVDVDANGDGIVDSVSQINEGSL